MLQQKDLGVHVHFLYSLAAYPLLNKQQDGRSHPIHPSIHPSILPSLRGIASLLKPYCSVHEENAYSSNTSVSSAHSQQPVSRIPHPSVHPSSPGKRKEKKKDRKVNTRRKENNSQKSVARFVCPTVAIGKVVTEENRNAVPQA